MIFSLVSFISIKNLRFGHQVTQSENVLSMMGVIGVVMSVCFPMGIVALYFYISKKNLKIYNQQSNPIKV